MGRPNLEACDIPTKLATRGEVVRGTLVVDGNAWPVTCVSLGGPHCVTFRGMEVTYLRYDLYAFYFIFRELFAFEISSNIVKVEVISM